MHHSIALMSFAIPVIALPHWAWTASLPLLVRWIFKSVWGLLKRPAVSVVQVPTGLLTGFVLGIVCSTFVVVCVALLCGCRQTA